MLVADGATSRIDVETCAIRVKRSPREAHTEPARSCFHLIAGHPVSKLSDALKSLFWCDQISSTNPSVQNFKRRLHSGSIISLCDVTESLDEISNSFVQNFPHLPQPAAAAAEIVKESDEPASFSTKDETIPHSRVHNVQIGIYE